jgi:acyl carrier protein
MDGQAVISEICGWLYIKLEVSFMEEIMEKIIEKSAALCGKDAGEITLDTKFVADLGMKSATLVVLIAYLEDEFDVSIDFMQFRRKATVREAAEYISNL